MNSFLNFLVGLFFKAKDAAAEIFGAVLASAKEALLAIQGKLRAGATILFLLGIGAAAVLMHGDREYNLQGVLLGLFRLNELLAWVWVSGILLDLANGVKYEDDRKLIQGGNMAVALSRSIGYAALVIGGAVLIART